MEAKDKARVPLKLGVRCHPLALTLVYREGERKRLRLMPIRFLNKLGGVGHIVLELKSRHQDYLGKVPDIRIEKMLRILQETEKGQSVSQASAFVAKEYVVDPEEDLNKISDEELTKKKKLMDRSFYKNQLKDGDEGFKYDIEVDFESQDKVDAGWDSDDDGHDFWS